MLMKNILLIAIAFTCFASCKKEIENLPATTETGANTFGARINGENWGPLGFGIVPTAPTLEARFWGDSSVFINARNFSRSPVETEMEIFLENISGPGIYPIKQTTAVFPNHSASYVYYLKRKFSVTDEWVTSSTATGQVQVTKMDWANKIISGSFSFTADAKYGSAPVVVTEGRFDVKIQ
jgi:hypothetical protein